MNETDLAKGAFELSEAFSLACARNGEQAGANLRHRVLTTGEEKQG